MIKFTKKKINDSAGNKITSTSYFEDILEA